MSLVLQEAEGGREGRGRGNPGRLPGSGGPPQTSDGTCWLSVEAEAIRSSGLTVKGDRLPRCVCSTPRPSSDCASEAQPRQASPDPAVPGAFAGHLGGAPSAPPERACEADGRACAGPRQVPRSKAQAGGGSHEAAAAPARLPEGRAHPAGSGAVVSTLLGVWDKPASVAVHRLSVVCHISIFRGDHPTPADFHSLWAFFFSLKTNARLQAEDRWCRA